MKTQHTINNPQPANDNILDNIEDEHFIAALSEAFRTYRTIQAHMNATGHPTTTNIICKRMNEFVEMFPDVIERRGKSWRIVPSEQEIVPAPALTTPTETPPINLRHGDCLDLFASIPDGSIRLGLIDPPYGITGHSFDRRVDMEKFMNEVRRVLHPQGTAIMFASQMFTAHLMMAAPDLFRYLLVWEKDCPTGSQNSGGQPMRYHENIVVFSKGTAVSPAKSKRAMTYNPQSLIFEGMQKYTDNRRSHLVNATPSKRCGELYPKFKNHPGSILRFAKDYVKKGVKTHPFAKPVALLEYLIRTYSNEGDIVFDPTMGSGSAALAAMNANRRFVGFEIDAKWFALAEDRVSKWTPPAQPIPANDDQPVITPLRKSRKARAA